MTTIRMISIIVGSLFILGMITGILSVVSVIDDPDYLIKISAKQKQVLCGAFFQFLMAVIYVCIAVLLYPVLRSLNQSLSVGFFSFRLIAGIFNFFGVLIILLLLSLSQKYVNSGNTDLSYFLLIGNMLRAARDLINHVFMILTLSLSGLMFYSLLYQTKLIPQWLSSWGIIGTIITIVASCLILFRFVEIKTPLYIILNLPLALQELALALFLITKGFNESVFS
jgi:hypothetical protein